jgi:flagellar motor switch protein FliG
MADANPAIRAPRGADAAAILLMLLDDHAASDIMRHLDPADVEGLGAAMFSVADVSEAEVEAVFGQFMNRARARTTVGFGSSERIRTVMESALGPARADTMLSRITPASHTRALDGLRWLDAESIAAVIEHEHPQITAIVLAHLEPGVAAEVLQMLPEATQADAIYRVANLGPVSAEALSDLEASIVDQVAQATVAATIARGGAGDAAKIMTNVRPGNDQKIIRSLNKIDKSLAGRIEDEMFVFDDLAVLDDKNLGTLLRNVDTSILVVALKGADAGLRERMLGSMSARAADSIRDEMAERGPTRLAEVLEAQKAIIAVARRLADEGTILLASRGDDYV